MYTMEQAERLAADFLRQMSAGWDNEVTLFEEDECKAKKGDFFLSGSRGTDFARSNRVAGLSETPDGYTWHHHQEPGLMQLIETEAHKRTAHTGGFSGGR